MNIVNIVVAGIGVIVISGCISLYFYRFWKVYEQQLEAKEYMQSDEYKEQMEKMKQLLSKKKDKKDVPKNMYR